MAAFSFSTIEGFDDHIQKSIQGFDILNEMIVNIAGYFLEDGTNYYDIGCSTGRLISQISDKYINRKVKLFGLEKEFNFIKDLKNSTNVSFLPIDVTQGFGFMQACFVTSVFTMQFIHPRHRERVLKDIHHGLSPGGAFIIAEKVFSESSRIQDMMTFLYYDYKRKSFSIDEIFGKERDLRALMRPQTLGNLVDSLNAAGFREIDVFWRNFNFVALICIKE